MSVSRSDGYRLGRGKEDATLGIVRDFCDSVLGVRVSTIAEPQRNRSSGDLDTGKSTIECKGQPIDPDRFDRNFVEVMEDTTAGAREYHRDGLRRTAEILSMSLERLVSCRYTDCRADRIVRDVGCIEYVSASLESVAGSEATVYANADPNRTFVYVYSQHYLLWHVRDAVLRNEMRRGMGASNEDTFGVLVPVSAARWRRIDGVWNYVGRGVEPVNAARRLLGLDGVP